MLSDVLKETPAHIRAMTDAEVQTELNGLFATALPRKAKKKRWSVNSSDTFRRIIYDNALGGKWDTIVQAPAIRNMSRGQLNKCLTLASALRDGKIIPTELLVRSNAMRG